MNNSDFLTKDEARGKRNNRNGTWKRTERHTWDDDKNTKGTRRGHSRHHEEIDETMFDDDHPYADFEDWKKYLK